jgi:hypothetical protein
VCNLTPEPILSKVGDNTFSLYLKNAKCYLNPATTTIISLTDGTYKARVSYTNSGGTVVKSESDATFKILPVQVPTLKVTYPNGNEKLITGKYYDLKYSLGNTAERSIKVSFLNYQGDSMYSTAIFGGGGKYNLRIPYSLDSGAYKLKMEMTATDGTKIEDTSDNFFWVSDSY